MSSLGSREKKLLLKIAREALCAAAERRELPENAPCEFVSGESTGAFVTLRKRGRLRGCIGQLGTGRPLAGAVAHSARSAALEDPRFDPVQPEEVPDIEIEISILSALEEIAPERIEAGKHGLLVSRGGQRGLLLPQVATEMRWSALKLLGETCVKAGLERHAWREPETKVQGFTAEVFSETEFPTDESAGAPGRATPRYSTST